MRENFWSTVHCLLKQSKVFFWSLCNLQTLWVCKRGNIQLSTLLWFFGCTMHYFTTKEKPWLDLRCFSASSDDAGEKLRRKGSASKGTGGQPGGVAASPRPSPGPADTPSPVSSEEGKSGSSSQAPDQVRNSDYWGWDQTWGQSKWISPETLSIMFLKRVYVPLS